MTDALAARLKKIKLLLLDVDGVLTAGHIIMGGSDEYKAFNVQDGLGIHLIQKAGIRVGIITGRQSRVVMQRARDLGISILFQGALDKTAAFDAILENEGLTAEEVCYVGDDLLDLPLIIRAGLGVSVPNGRREVHERADWITETAGGEGAVREVVETILKAQAKWDDIVHHYSA